MKAWAGKRGGRGFTLVELLVAVAISSIVILAVCTASSAGWRLWRRVEDRRPIDQQAAGLIDAMRKELAGAYQPGDGTESGSGFVHFVARDRGEEMIAFFTTTPSYRRGVGPGKCARVTYEYRKVASGMNSEQQGSGGVLVRREQLVAGEEPIAEPTAEIIARGVASFSIECLDGKGKAQTAEDTANRLPRMVKLQVAWAAKSPSQNPEIRPAGSRSHTGLGMDSKGSAGGTVAYSAAFLVPVEGALQDANQGAGA